MGGIDVTRPQRAAKHDPIMRKRNDYIEPSKRQINRANRMAEAATEGQMPKGNSADKLVKEIRRYNFSASELVDEGRKAEKIKNSIEDSIYAMERTYLWEYVNNGEKEAERLCGDLISNGCRKRVKRYFDSIEKGERAYEEMKRHAGKITWGRVKKWLWTGLLAAQVPLAGCTQKEAPKPKKSDWEPHEFDDTVKKDSDYFGVEDSVYDKEMKELYDHFTKMVGVKKPASACIAERGWAFYHIFEDNDLPDHIRNSKGTTSETETAMFSAMVEYGAMTGDWQGAEMTYKYLREKMMPSDGVNDPDLKWEGTQSYAKMPFIQWLIQVEDGGKGVAVFPGDDQMYEVYDGIRLSQGSYESKFSVAPDADQWMVKALYKMSKETGKQEYKDLADKMGTALHKYVLSDSDQYPGTVIFGLTWGTTNGGAWLAKEWGQNYSYAGYQDPLTYHKAGFEDDAKKQVSFLKDAQDEYEKRYGESGPFMPVYDRSAHSFGWNGPDGNTHWMGFQYRAVRNLAEYYAATGDMEAKQIVEKFNSWLTKNSKIDANDVELPTDLNKSTGAIEKKGYEPHGAALIGQELIELAAKDKDKSKAQMADYILKDMTRHKGDNGAYKNGDGLTFEFHQAEYFKTLIYQARKLQK